MKVEYSCEGADTGQELVGHAPKMILFIVEAFSPAEEKSESTEDSDSAGRFTEIFSQNTFQALTRTSY